MSIVSVHGPNMWGGTGAGGEGSGATITAPQVAATADMTDGLTFTFQATPPLRENPDEYSWDFGDATPDNGDGPGPHEVVFDAPGDHEVVLSIASVFISVTNKALTTNVATLTTDVPHGLQVGEEVEVNIADAVFDGFHTVTGTPTPTTFTYAKVNANVASAAAEGNIYANGDPAAGDYPITVEARAAGPRTFARDGDGDGEVLDLEDASFEAVSDDVVDAEIVEVPEVQNSPSEPAQGTQEQPTIPYDPTDHTVDEVADYAEVHPEEVERILNAEKAGKNRKTLISQLEAFLGDQS